MNLTPVLRQRYLDANGDPLAGGKLYCYAAGTTTPQATYTDQAGGTANANPVVLDANGEANVWLDPELSYKFVLADSNDVTQWTVDNVVGLLGEGSVVTASIQDDAVTQAKIADDAVGADQLKDSASVDLDRPVTTNHIRDSAVTTAKVADGAITQAKRAALGHQISSSSGGFFTTSGTLTDVTNLSVSITTTGRPVMLALVGDGTAPAGDRTNTSFLECNGTSSGIIWAFLRDSTVVCSSSLLPSATVLQLGLTKHIDVPAAGTYTYKFQISTGGSDTAYVNRMKLIAFEL